MSEESNLATLEDAKFFRKKKFFELRLSGKSITAIAAEHGLSGAQVSYDISAYARELRLAHYEETEPIVAMEVARLDKMTDAIMPRAEQGDLEAIDMVLKIQMRKARMLGLDKPTKFEHKVDNSGRPKKELSQGELEDRMIRLYDRLRARGSKITPNLAKFVESRRVIDITPVEVDSTRE